MWNLYIEIVRGIKRAIIAMHVIRLLRASQSIPLNIAEGNGRRGSQDRRRFFDIARASALECAAIQDVLIIGKALSKKQK